MGRNNYMIVVTAGGKVTDLHWSKDLVELNTIRMMHPESDVEVVSVVADGSTQEVLKSSNGKAYSRNGKPFANKVRCVETGDVYWSVADCSKKTGIPPVSIYKSIRTGNLAFGKHFVYCVE